jgi:dolichyl-phosphate beta-glucosyltransferase
MDRIELSVIIPVYNEEKRVPKTLDAVFAYLKAKKVPSEIIVVDDGSSDRTLEVVGAFKRKTTARQKLVILKQKTNRGKGSAVRTGALAAKGRIVLYMDADNATPITEFERFKPAFQKGYEVVVGSRALDRKQVKVHQPLYREAIGRVGNILIQLLVIPGIADTQCGFKAFTQKAAKTVFPLQTIDRFGFDVELLYIAKKHRFKILETPVEWFDDPNTRVNAVRDSIRTFTELFIIRWNALRGRYGYKNIHVNRHGE